jgi:hypothetical protein
MGPKRFGAKGKLAFSFGNVAQDEGSAMAQYAWSKGWKSASLATDTVIVYFKDVVKAFKARYTQLGGKIVDEETYQSLGSTNVTNAVTRLNGKKADVIVTATAGAFGALPQLIAGLRTLGQPLAQDDESRPVMQDILDLDAFDVGRSPGRIIVPAERAHGRTERGSQDIAQVSTLQFGHHPLSAKSAVPAHQGDAHLGGQSRERVAQEGGRTTHTGGVARPQPKMGDLGQLCQRGDNGPVTRLQSFTGVAHPHAFLMAIFVQQGK